MVRKLQYASTNPLPGNSDQVGTAEKHPSESSGLRDQIEKLLQAGRPKKTLDVLARSKDHSSWSTNAVAVCLLRVGQTDRAIELFRNLVLSGNLLLRSDVPTTWKINFATTLLMSDNLFGCIRILRDVRDESHPSVQRLRGAIRQWEKELSLWEKIQWLLGGQPACRVRLDFPPGEL